MVRLAASASVIDDEASPPKAAMVALSLSVPRATESAIWLPVAKPVNPRDGIRRHPGGQPNDGRPGRGRVRLRRM